MTDKWFKKKQILHAIWRLRNKIIQCYENIPLRPAAFGVVWKSLQGFWIDGARLRVMASFLSFPPTIPAIPYSVYFNFPTQKLQILSIFFCQKNANFKHLSNEHSNKISDWINLNTYFHTWFLDEAYLGACNLLVKAKSK